MLHPPAAGPSESIVSHRWAFNKIFLSAWTATFWNSAHGSTLPEAASSSLSGRQGPLKPPVLPDWKSAYSVTFSGAWYCDGCTQMSGEQRLSSHGSGGCCSILQRPLEHCARSRLSQVEEAPGRPGDGEFRWRDGYKLGKRSGMVEAKTESRRQRWRVEGASLYLASPCPAGHGLCIRSQASCG